VVLCHVAGGQLDRSHLEWGKLELRQLECGQLERCFLGRIIIRAGQVMPALRMKTRMLA